MPDLKEYIKEKRPNLSPTIVKTYNSILTNLYKKVFGNEGSTFDTNKFNDDEKILHFLRQQPPNKRKTILSALVIVTENKAYRDLMLEDIKVYNADIAKQEKTPTQKENWVTGTEIKQLWLQLKHNTDLLYKKAHLTSSDLQQIELFVLLSLLGGVFIAPRRALDYVHFKIKSIDKTKDNFLDKSALVFNTYKTANVYGQQRVSIPAGLKAILKKWIKINPTEYLFFDSNMNPLTSVKLNQRLNKLFDGKKIGVNTLRHSYLSDKYGSTIETNKDLANDLSNMGSSMAQAQTYIKEG